MALKTFKSRNKVRLVFAGVLVLVILAGFLDYPVLWDRGVDYINNLVNLQLPHFVNLPFRLGLDLQGGTHLVYKADVSQINGSEQASAVEGVRDVIERRVNAYGVAEPLVQTNKRGDEWRIIVELAGVKNVNDAIKMIGETPILEFKTQKEGVENRALTDDEKKFMADYNQQAKTRAEDALKKVLEPNADFASLADQYSEDEGNKDQVGNKQGGLIDWFGRGAMVAGFDKVVFEEAKTGEIYPNLLETEYGYHVIKKEGDRVNDQGVAEAQVRHILIRTLKETDILQLFGEQWENTQLSGKQLVKSIIQFDPQTSEPIISLEFNDEGKEIFGQLTEANVGKPIGIFLDGESISTPKVNEPIREGKAIITGKFTLPEAKLLAQRLNAGALPVPIAIIQQQTVGASLGQDSVAKSLKAGWWGLLLVALFMILYYRLPGILAVLALGVYGILLLAIFKLWPVTLTLPGIAGFVMSMGMAVDANVLIFERLKEELSLGRTLGSAIDEGFKR
ncbi:MAG: protein translocase subunit SecD, partial [bacterium]